MGSQSAPDAGTKFGYQDQPKSAAMDQAVDAQTKAASQTPDQLKEKLMGGVSGPGGPQAAKPETLQLQANALGGNTDPGTMQAIVNRKNKVFDSSVSKLGRQVETSVPMMQAKNFQDTSSVYGKAYAHQVEDYKNRSADYQHAFNLEKFKNAQKNAVINSILGLGGQLAGLIGGAATGGVKGAMEGMQMGGQVGGMAGNIATGGAQSAGEV